MQIRLARTDDVAALNALIARSARALSRDHYTDAQIEAALLSAYGVDTQLILDGTYYIAEYAGVMAGCGGWSRRAKIFGSDARQERQDEGVAQDASRTTLDPAVDAARIRAFFIEPKFARQGLARALLAQCERAAQDAGFTTFALMATLPGVAFYEAAGYSAAAPEQHTLSNDVVITFVPMRKSLKREA
jgi:GNAT superfamily N-acetyltransferase